MVSLGLANIPVVPADYPFSSLSIQLRKDSENIFCKLLVILEECGFNYTLNDAKDRFRVHRRRNVSDPADEIYATTVAEFVPVFDEQNRLILDVVRLSNGAMEVQELSREIYVAMNQYELTVEGDNETVHDIPSLNPFGDSGIRRITAETAAGSAAFLIEEKARQLALRLYGYPSSTDTPASASASTKQQQQQQFIPSSNPVQRSASNASSSLSPVAANNNNTSDCDSCDVDENVDVRAVSLGSLNNTSATASLLLGTTKRIIAPEHTLVSTQGRQQQAQQ